MAEMGTKGLINLTSNMMKDAKSAINEYRETVRGLNQQLTSEITNLIPSSFSGAAADGYQKFYTESIVPNLDVDSENGGLYKMLSTIDSICDSINQQIPDLEGVDDQLAKSISQ